ncbi:unnamed protein product [Nezara viridula]|uniref:Uncharacterized protein n=1 Tax=Nezara viridula TaxID=85310 RepID=A0A9P0MVZ8_NEZVI|nr:unnamed protein product [Nezara viridula]
MGQQRAVIADKSFSIHSHTNFIDSLLFINLSFLMASPSSKRINSRSESRERTLAIREGQRERAILEGVARGREGLGLISLQRNSHHLTAGPNPSDHCLGTD